MREERREKRQEIIISLNTIIIKKKQCEKEEPIKNNHKHKNKHKTISRARARATKIIIRLSNRSVLKRALPVSSWRYLGSMKMMKKVGLMLQ